MPAINNELKVCRTSELLNYFSPIINQEVRNNPSKPAQASKDVLKLFADKIHSCTGRHVVFFAHSIDGGRVLVTPHGHEDLDDALGSASAIADRDSHCVDDKIDLVSVFVISEQSLGFGIAGDLLNRITVGIGNDWSRADIDLYFEHALDALRNAENSQNRFTVIGSRFAGGKLVFREQFFCVNESDCEPEYEKAHRSGFIYASLPVYSLDFYK